VVLFDDENQLLISVMRECLIQLNRHTEDINIEFLSDLDKLMVGLRSRAPATGIVQGVND
jgi:hypothetical protein